MERLYSYYDYEEAYYHQQWYKCIEIGTYLLPYIKDKRSKQLLKKLSKLNYRWEMPEDEAKEFAQVLLDVKIWLMVNQC